MSLFSKIFSDQKSSSPEDLTNFQDSQQELKKLEALFESMSAGLVFCDQNLQIQRANPAFYRLFSLSQRSEGKSFLEIIRQEELHSFLQKALSQKEKIEEEIIFHHERPKRYFTVQAIPIREENLSGVLSIFQDISHTKALEQSRQDFVANVSHELKTPLTSIRGYAETLLNGALEKPETGKRFVEKIHRHAQDLQKLIEELLDLSRLDAGRQRLSKEVLDLQLVLQECIQNFTEAFEKKNIILQLKLNSPSKVLGEASLMKQIFFNLLQNALHYTSSGGTVQVQVDSSASQVTVQVQDSGIGISAQDLPHIFERFWRADKARSRESGGTGLGLAIVKHLTQELGGEVKVSSELGKGTNFAVSFPLA